MKATGFALAVATCLGATAFVIADDVAEQDRDVGAFERIKVKGSMDVNVSVGNERSVKVIADSDIIDHVRTDVTDGELVIGLKDKGHHWSRIDRLQVVVSVPKLTAANLTGSGDLTIDDIAAETFDLVLKGSGDAIIEDADVVTMRTRLQGSGDIELAGSCKTLSVTLQGSGDVEAEDFKCEIAQIELRGSGDVEAYASETADVEIRGSGDVYVRGNPSMNSRVRGSGEVHAR